MSEGVKILISADDQASKVLANVATNVDAKVKQIKEVGRGAKASTEFIGTLANSLGGSVIGSYAAGIAQLTERISNFSEVSKAGAGGALAFKAGLAGVALVAGFKIGTMIGDVVFQTSRWKQELADANEQLTKAAAKAGEMAAVKLSFRVEKAELGGEVESRKLLKDLASEAFAIEEKIAATKKEQLADNAGLVGYARSLAGTADDIAALNKAELADDEAKLAAINNEREALEKKLSPYQKEIDLLKEAASLKKRNDDFIKGLQEEVDLLKASKDERAEIQAMQKAGGDTQAAAKIEALLREKEALEEKAVAAKLIADEEKKQADDKVRDAERLEALAQKELNHLEEQRIELEKGKEAAHAFKLEKEGLNKTLAAKIAKEQAEIDTKKEDKESAKKLEEFKKPEMQAVQSRLLTRGPMEKGIDKVAKHTEGALKELKLIREKLPLSTSTSQMEFVA